MLHDTLATIKPFHMYLSPMADYFREQCMGFLKSSNFSTRELCAVVCFNSQVLAYKNSSVPTLTKDINIHIV